MLPKATRIHLVLLLALALSPRAGLAAGHDPSPPACRPVEGLAPLLQPGTILLLGEIHGSRESPTFVANAACLAARAGTGVTVGLEISGARGAAPRAPTSPRRAPPRTAPPS